MRMLSKKRKIGILTFSDGRQFAHEQELEITKRFEERLVNALEATGEVECVTAEIIWTNELARSEAVKIANHGVEMTIFHFPIWAFPHFPAIAARFAPGPFLLYSNINPQYSGLVALLCTAGGLDAIGDRHFRISGDIERPEVLKRVMAVLRAGSAVSRLRGETYGVFGGRSMGMYTAVPDLAQWQRDFGIDIEHIDQWEIVRRSEFVSQEKVTNARLWLEKHCLEVGYDSKILTPEKLERQIRSYYAIRDMVSEMHLDFVGIKGQPELTDNFCTMDVAEAFLNDPYDWDGPHEPIVCATEADSDAALTMEIFKHIAQTPVLFADIRHYDEDGDFWDLTNSGQHPTYFANGSFDPLENMSKVRLLPEVFFFPAGGASVQHIAKPGTVTLGRMSRKEGKYWLAIVPGEILDMEEKISEMKARNTTWEWAHAFTRIGVTPEQFIDTYSSNHIHGVYGDYTQELINVCKVLGIEYKVLG